MYNFPICHRTNHIPYILYCLLMIDSTPRSSRDKHDTLSTLILQKTLNQLQMLFCNYYPIGREGEINSKQWWLFYLQPNYFKQQHFTNVHHAYLVNKQHNFSRGVFRWLVLTANNFESGPMPTPWNFLDGPPLLPSCKLG